jgi:hypothetical protein
MIQEITMTATMENTNFTTFAVRSSDEELNRRMAFLEMFRRSPIPPTELLYSQLSVYLPRQELSRILAVADLYRDHVVSTNGIIIEFGTCYGRTASLLTNLRGIFEPYNFTRKLVIFDTFSGLRGVSEQDGSDKLAVNGSYSSGSNYREYLEDVLTYHESEAPIAHIKKFELRKGDASETLPLYLKEHPETVIALAYFDFDIYAPTKACLEAIRPHLTRNSLLVFDQLNCPEFPGETRALAEVFGLERCASQRSPLTPWMSWTTCESLLD